MSTALWKVYDFEVDMFTEMLRIGTTVECQRFPELVQNAIVESMLLHLRILVDILLSRGYRKNDDINLTDLLPSFKSSVVAQLKTAYGDASTVDCPCWHLNKRLAHPTQIRCSPYSYDDLLHALIPIVRQLLAEIAAARQVSP